MTVGRGGGVGNLLFLPKEQRVTPLDEILGFHPGGGGGMTVEHRGLFLCVVGLRGHGPGEAWWRRRGACEGGRKAYRII